MTKIWAISLRELRSYFVSPVAYGIIAAFSIITGYFFYVSLSFFLDNSTRIIMEAQMSQQLPPPVNVNTEVVRPLFDNIAFISIFMIAMITMRLFAEEKKMMTIELLFTSPITNFQTIMGKFLAGYLLYCTMLLPTVVYFIILVIFGNPEILPIVTAYLGLMLIGAVLTSVGLLVSSFTSNQLVAVALSFGIFLFLWVIDWPADIIGNTTVGSILKYISLPAHFNDFTKGVIDSSHIIYYISLVALSLFLTFRSLESMKWRS